MNSAAKLTHRPSALGNVLIQRLARAICVVFIGCHDEIVSLARSTLSDGRCCGLGLHRSPSAKMMESATPYDLRMKKRVFWTW